MHTSQPHYDLDSLGPTQKKKKKQKIKKKKKYNFYKTKNNPYYKKMLHCSWVIKNSTWYNMS
ncbi:hypothetical protein HmCmsJML015_04020 [Escherichia coli]|nr:hypothetical protein HmCmsJML015_04020 [Escherichia coli]